MASFSQLRFIDALLDRALLTVGEYQEVRCQSNGDLTSGEAEALISYLLDNQTDPIEAGRPYSQTDIQKKLSQWKQY